VYAAYLTLLRQVALQGGAGARHLHINFKHPESAPDRLGERRTPGADGQ